MSFIVIIGILIIILVVSLVIKQKLATSDTIEDTSFEAAALFSPAERSFLGVLDQALSQQYRIMGKVRLADIIKVKSGVQRSTRQTGFNKIQSKHVDFVACDLATLAVKFAIELDDASHSEPKRQERDDFLNKAMKDARIPIYHFSAKRTYTLQEIQKAIVATKPVGTSGPINSQKTQGNLSSNERDIGIADVNK